MDLNKAGGDGTAALTLIQSHCLQRPGQKLHCTLRNSEDKDYLLFYAVMDPSSQTFHNGVVVPDKPYIREFELFLPCSDEYIEVQTDPLWITRAVKEQLDGNPSHTVVPLGFVERVDK